MDLYLFYVQFTKLSKHNNKQTVDSNNRFLKIIEMKYFESFRWLLFTLKKKIEILFFIFSYYTIYEKNWAKFFSIYLFSKGPGTTTMFDWDRK